MVKTITVTDEAYQRMKELKLGEESFSDLFTRIANEKGNAIKKYFGCIKSTPEEIKERRKQLAAVREQMSKDFKDRITRLNARRKELTN